MLNCYASASQPPNITWYKDGAELVVTKRVTMETEVLRITDVVASDAGSYKCVINNSDEFQYTATVKIIGKLKSLFHSYLENMIPY